MAGAPPTRRRDRGLSDVCEKAVETTSPKVIEIERACRDRDVDRLVALAASSGGFLTDALRRDAWSILLGCTTLCDASGHKQDEQDAWTTLAEHKDEDQVRLDVARAFVYYPLTDKGYHDSENATLAAKEALKTQLSDLIVSTLRRHPCLNYFQGYHDIAQVLLLVLGSVQAASEPLARLSLLRIRDFMLPSMDATNSHLELLPPILFAADEQLYDRLSVLYTRQSPPKQTPFFALSATLTMYAHDIEEYSSIARVFDFLLSHEAAMSVYMYAAIVLVRKDDLAASQADEEGDDPAIMYAILSRLPRGLDIEVLIADTLRLRAAHPPHRLPFRTWSRVSRYSVLETTRCVSALERQSLGQGEAWMAAQEAEMELSAARARRIQMLRQVIRRYRMPAGMAVAALIVGAISVWLARSGHGGLLLTRTSEVRLLGWRMFCSLQRSMGLLA